MTGSYFEIDANWPANVADDAVDIAEISIRAGDEVLTRLADFTDNTNRDFFRASAMSLALWVADNWWRLRHEPIDDPQMPSVDWRLRHELSSAPGGTLWPPLMIYSVGERVVLSPISRRRSVLGPLQYLDHRVRVIGGSQFEHGIDNFFNLVRDNCARAADAQALEVLVGQLVTERSDPMLAAWRRLEACLGFDADEAPSAVIEKLLGLAAQVGKEAIEEAAIAHPGAESPAALEEVFAASLASTVEADFGLADRVDPTRHTPPFASPWRLAESAARQVRDLLAFEGPISDKQFASMVLMRWEQLKDETSTRRIIPYAARLHVKGTKEKLALQSQNEIDQRFEISRLLGDAIWTKQSTFGVVSNASTDRQKFQRAFAQSLLVPVDDIRVVVNVDNPRPEQIDDAAVRFGVHRNVVRNLLAYKGILPETLEDERETV